jgi:uncharacterized protein YtpQ (UPF0354 family)
VRPWRHEGNDESNSSAKGTGKFAAKVIAGLQRSATIPADSSVLYEPDEFRVRVGDSTILNFANFFAEYQRYGFFSRRKGMREIIGRLTAVLAGPEIPTDLASAAVNILPRVRERAFWDINRRQFRLDSTSTERNKQMNPLTRIMFEEFDVEFVYDSPQTVMTIMPERLAAWGTTFDDFWPVALANLRKLSSKPFVTSARGLYVSDWQDSHDASRILLPDVIRTLNVQGHYLAMVPNRDLLLVADSNNEAALLEMAARTRAMMDEPRFMTATVFRLVGESW